MQGILLLDVCNKICPSSELSVQAVVQLWLEHPLTGSEQDWMGLLVHDFPADSSQAGCHHFFTACHPGTRILSCTTLGKLTITRATSVQVSKEDSHLGKVAKWALDNVKRPLVIVRTFQPAEAALVA